MELIIDDKKAMIDIQGNWQFVKYSFGAIEMKCNTCFVLIIGSNNRGEILNIDDSIDIFEYKVLNSVIEFKGLLYNPYLTDDTKFDISVKYMNKKKYLLLSKSLNGFQYKYLFN